MALAGASKERWGRGERESRQQRRSYTGGRGTRNFKGKKKETGMGRKVGKSSHRGRKVKGSVGGDFQRVEENEEGRKVCN